MEQIKLLTKKEIESLNFSETVGLINEPNRCSGGAHTIRRILQETMLPSGSTIVEIGSNTGYSSIEFALMRRDCNVIGIDINSESVAHSTKKALEFKVPNVAFKVEDGSSCNLGDNCADLLFVSNVTSFIKEREKAISEYGRILKDNGVLAAVQIHYKSEPPTEIKKKVEEAIGTKLTNNTIDYWKSTFQDNLPELRLVFEEEYKYDYLRDDQIEAYTEEVIKTSQYFDTAMESVVTDRLNYFFKLFNENLKYCGFTILLYQKTYANREPELYTSYKR